ncbi:MAG: NAD(P)H-dependent flavin oxidoreductase, partial [Gammaproteobacteria bacterium]
MRENDMWPGAELTDLLQIKHPIIQAPMAGSTNPELVGAVSNAGGLGSHGCARMSAAELIETAKETRAITDRPFNLNFFAHAEPANTPEEDANVLSLLADSYHERGIGELPENHKTMYDSFDENILAALLEIKPGVVSFHFGLPTPEMLGALRDAGCIILCSATTVAEARVLADSGVDAIIAQGWEAGGHRGTFHTSFEDFGIGTIALVPQIVDAVDIPVIAAGGIADARGIAAAFKLGASGVQLGSAFLSCPEASISDAHRSAIRNARDDDTRLTRAFSGRPARARNNPYMEKMVEQRTRFPDFPMMYKFSRPLMESSAENNDNDFSFLLYGQATALNCELPAFELLVKLAKESQ